MENNTKKPFIVLLAILLTLLNHPPIQASPDHTYTVFHDDFETGDTRQWTTNIPPEAPHGSSVTVETDGENHVLYCRGQTWVETGDQQWTNYTVEDGLAGDIVYAIAQDPQGVFWFGTNRGISRFDGTHWQTYDQHQGMTNLDVYALAVTPAGQVWAGSKGAVVLLGQAREEVSTP